LVPGVRRVWLANLMKAESKHLTAADDLRRSDRLLVDRCLAGDGEAWDEMYRRFHATLLASIRSQLSPGVGNLELVEEIAARVWYSLVAKGGDLLNHYDPRRGSRLSRYLSILARSEATRFFRGERRRRGRERLASRKHADWGGLCESLSRLDLEEFLATLTRRERDYFELYLLRQPTTSSLSPANRWQLSRRIRGKLKKHLQT
jgi:hypothetical protein